MWPLPLDPPFSLHIHPLESKLQYDGGEAGVSLGGVSLRAGVCVCLCVCVCVCERERDGIGMPLPTLRRASEVISV